MKLLRWTTRIAMAAAAISASIAIALPLLFRLAPFPARALDRPTSILVTDRSGTTLLKAVGSDDQWREPIALADMGPWIAAATIATEDERFYSHGGIDPIAITRAICQNLGSGRVVSGASTITMQLARLCDPRPRTLSAKAIQAFRAIQLEKLLPKIEILEHYLNLAPYGGNICGIESAAHRYFGKRAADLTLAEAALLAGIPKSPERLRPDRHADAAKVRRNWVLHRMLICGNITAAEHKQALAEPITLAPTTDPIRAPHAAWLAVSERPQGGRTTIDLALQTRLEQLITAQSRSLPQGTQISAAIIDIQAGELVALVGSSDPTSPNNQVDGATAFRSPGSALKPFVYAAAMESHRLAPDSLVYDLPIQRGGWKPVNFSRGFAGELTAADALRKSLNVPAILIAEATGLNRCIQEIESAGVQFQTDPARRGGLAVVVGAVEVRLLDLTNAYATLGRGGIFQDVSIYMDQPRTTRRVLSPEVSATISDILSCRNRSPHGMESRPDIPWFCWKTGTSSGRRDAWAVGHNTRYAAGVWVGDFSGKGRIQYLGFDTAEPLLADILTMPTLAAINDPPKPAPITVSRPLPKPAEAAPALRITSPGRDAEFLSIRGTALIAPQSNQPGTWFLDGMALASTVDLRIPPGTHELRCITSRGEADSVRITVK